MTKTTIPVRKIRDLVHEVLNGLDATKFPDYGLGYEHALLAATQAHQLLSGATDPQLEGMARIIEHLLDELRRRGVTPEVDLSFYDEYRTHHPKEDA